MTGRRPGPPPMSADVVELHGNRAHLTRDELEKRREEEVRPRPIRPTKPPGLSRYAGEAWDHHVPELERLGLLTRLDAGSFHLLCESYAIALEALDAMRPAKADGTPDRRRKGLAVTESDRVHGGQIRKSPAVTIYFQAAKDYRAWCVEFGLTPAARLGLRPAAASSSGEAGHELDDDDGVTSFLGH